MDRVLTIRTPEIFRFGFRLAGVGSRFLACAANAAARVFSLAVLARLDRAAFAIAQRTPAGARSDHRGLTHLAWALHKVRVAVGGADTG